MTIINPESMVLTEYNYAKNFFEKRLFDDSIIHAIRAAEIALAFGIEDNLNDVRRSELKDEFKDKGMMLSDLIKEATKQKILRKPSISIAWQLNDFRNIYFHIGNFLTHSFQIINGRKEIVKKYFNKLNPNNSLELIDPSFRTKTHIDNFDSLSKMMENHFKSVNVPSLDWMCRDDVLKFQNLYFEKYMQIITEPDNFKKIANFFLNQKQPIDMETLSNDFRLQFDFLGSTANEVLSLSKKFIEAIGFKL